MGEGNEIVENGAEHKKEPQGSVPVEGERQAEEVAGVLVSFQVSELQVPAPPGSIVS